MVQQKIKQLEKVVQRQCIDWLTANKWMVFRSNNVGVYNAKFKGYHFAGRKGLPDIIAVKPDYPALFVECKSTTGKLSEEQKDALIVINQTTAVGLVVHSLKELITQVDNILPTMRKEKVYTIWFDDIEKENLEFNEKGIRDMVWDDMMKLTDCKKLAELGKIRKVTTYL